MIEVPAPLRRAALQTAEGRAWLQALPAHLSGLADRWQLLLGDAISGGSASYVVRTARRDGTPAVLKVALPGGIEGLGPFDVELDALLAGGPTYVAVLEHDREEHAVLLEELGPPVGESGLPLAERLEIIAGTLRQAWVSASAVPSATTLAAKGLWLADFIGRTWEATGRPCSPRVVEVAREHAQAGAARYAEESAVLLHGDGHSFNTLTSLDGYRLIDPDPVRGEPAYDLAIALREIPTEVLGPQPGTALRELCVQVAAGAADPEHVWQWAFVERVSTGLLCARLGHDEWAASLLSTAEALIP